MIVTALTNNHFQSSDAMRLERVATKAANTKDVIENSMGSVTLHVTVIKYTSFA